jgi:hypothetical protein
MEAFAANDITYFDQLPLEEATNRVNCGRAVPKLCECLVVGGFVVHALGHERILVELVPVGGSQRTTLRDSCFNSSEAHDREDRLGLSFAHG